MSTASTPLILVTNDDGIGSPGLRAAVAAISDLGQVVVAAPRSQQSGAGRSMPAYSSGRIFEYSLKVNGAKITAYAVEGAPARFAIADQAGRRHTGFARCHHE